jgi:hypothetical protein
LFPTEDKGIPKELRLVIGLPKRLIACFNKEFVIKGPFQIERVIVNILYKINYNNKINKKKIKII